MNQMIPWIYHSSISRFPIPWKTLQMIFRQKHPQLKRIHVRIGIGIHLFSLGNYRIRLYFLLLQLGFSAYTEKEEYIHNVLSYYSHSNISLRNMKKTAELINMTPGADTTIPTTQHMLKKVIRPCYDYFIHIECQMCKIFTPTESKETRVQCEKCERSLQKKKSNYFVFIPFAQQMISVVSENVDKIIKYNEKCVNANGMIDIQNGNIFKKAAAKFPESIILSLVLNTDGASKFSSTVKSLWPIQLYQNYLPPSNRYISNNILVIGLYYGQFKPKLRHFIFPLAKELRRILCSNGLSITHNNTNLNFIPLVTHCSCDLPAKVMLQEMISYNGYSACGYCKHPGVPIENNNSKKTSTVR